MKRQLQKSSVLFVEIQTVSNDDNVHEFLGKG